MTTAGADTILWYAMSGAAGAVAVVQLLLLAHRRRRFIADPVRRSFFVRSVRGAAQPEMGRAPAQPTHPVALPAQPSSPAAASGEDGVVYVDATGHCTFANQAARQLLHWSAGERTLDELLAGGSRESAALLRALAQQGLVEAHPTALVGTREAIELSAVALRDRDDNLWGAALLMHRQQMLPPVSPEHTRS